MRAGYRAHEIFCLENHSNRVVSVHPLDSGLEETILDDRRKVGIELEEIQPGEDLADLAMHLGPVSVGARIMVTAPHDPVVLFGRLQSDTDLLHVLHGDILLLIGSLDREDVLVRVVEKDIPTAEAENRRVELLVLERSVRQLVECRRKGKQEYP